MLLTALVLLWNFFVSFWNARICGLTWNETRVIGGWGRVVTWSAAIQSAIGFTMLFVFLEAGLASLFFPIAAKLFTKMYSLFYLAVIFPALGTGLIILVHSWIEAFKRKDFSSIGTAAINSLTMANNIAQSTSGITHAFDVVSDMFGGDDEDSNWALLFVAIAFFLGGITTYGIIEHYKGRLDISYSGDTA